VKARQVSGVDPAAPMRPNAGRIVATRLDELLSLAGPAMDPAAAAAQHDLRIAAKRLRYVLEVAGRCFGEEARSVERAARELQDVLGEIHDCDVMLPGAEGIDSLRQLLRTRRELLFRRFVELWTTESERGTWSALRRAL
jgi:CHAD domain-containing protein